MSGQCCIHSSGVICTPKHPCSSNPSHIAGLACQTTTSYQMIKAVECIHHGDTNFPRLWSASLDFANADSDSNSCGGDPMKSSGVMSCAFPGKQLASPVSRTDDEVAQHGH